MPDQRSEIKAQISSLVSEGEDLHLREMVAQASQESREEFARMLEAEDASQSAEKQKSTGAAPKARGSVKDIFTKPDFGAEYQTWYTPSLRVIEQLLPDRYAEFRDLYKPDRRKAISLESYGVADYISGISIRSGISREPAFNIRSAAMNRFEQQIAILSTAKDRLDSILTDLGQIVKANLLDDELAVANELLRGDHVRSAGVIAGVVLEAHLKSLLFSHKVPLRKKHMLTNLNDALKDAKVYDVPIWRKVQYLADVRNMCAHKSERDPRSDEVESLISEVDKIVRTVF